MTQWCRLRLRSSSSRQRRQLSLRFPTGGGFTTRLFLPHACGHAFISSAINLSIRVFSWAVTASSWQVRSGNLLLFCKLRHQHAFSCFQLLRFRVPSGVSLGKLDLLPLGLLSALALASSNFTPKTLISGILHAAHIARNVCPRSL